MKLKLTHSIERAAVKSGFSCATGYRINKDSRHPSEKPKCPVVVAGRIHWQAYLRNKWCRCWRNARTYVRSLCIGK